MPLADFKGEVGPFAAPARRKSERATVVRFVRRGLLRWTLLAGLTRKITRELGELEAPFPAPRGPAPPPDRSLARPERIFQSGEKVALKLQAREERAGLPHQMRSGSKRRGDLTISRSLYALLKFQSVFLCMIPCVGSLPFRPVPPITPHPSPSLAPARPAADP